jgi:hypothetical protein
VVPARRKAYGNDRTPAPMQELHSVKTEEKDVAPLWEPRTILVRATPSTSSMMTLATICSSSESPLSKGAVVPILVLPSFSIARILIDCKAAKSAAC